MNSEFIFIALLCVINLEFIFDQVLAILNAKSYSKLMPQEVCAYYDEKTYLKQQQYDKSKFVVARISDGISFLIILFMIVAGGFAWVDTLVRSLSDNEIIRTLFFFGMIAFTSQIVSIPIDIYSTFVIEEKFGFNKTTIKTYIADMLKGWLLALAIGAPLLAFIVYLYQSASSWFWVLAWVVVSLFSVFVSYFYTTLLVPVFNKLTPLPEGELRDAIQAVANKTGFSLSDIFIMNGSKRSSKGNAYFSGFGRKKSIVLFDTLIEAHTTDELVSILTHEIGHYKKKHVAYGLILGLIQMGIMFYLLSLLLPSASVSQAIGVEEPSFYAGLLVFGILLSPLSTLMGIGMNIISRKNEYEADKFATDHSDGAALIAALIKLSVNNLSNLTPHWFYVFIHYSHPTLLKRIKDIRSNMDLNN